MSDKELNFTVGLADYGFTLKIEYREGANALFIAGVKGNLFGYEISPVNYKRLANSFNIRSKQKPVKCTFGEDKTLTVIHGLDNSKLVVKYPSDKGYKNSFAFLDIEEMSRLKSAIESSIKQ